MAKADAQMRGIVNITVWYSSHNSDTTNGRLLERTVGLIADLHHQFHGKGCGTYVSQLAAEYAVLKFHATRRLCESSHEDGLHSSCLRRAVFKGI